MNAQDLLSLINEIEIDLPVSDWRLHGIQLWPIIRSRLFFSAFDEALGSGWDRGGSIRRASRRVLSAVRSGGASLRNAMRGPGPCSTAEAVIVTDGIATACLNGFAYDIVGDPLRELIHACGSSTSTWYTTYSCPEPRLTEGALVQWRLDAAQLVGFVSTVRSGGAATEPNGYDAFLDLVRSAGLPAAAVSLARMNRLAARVALMAERISTWLRSISPRVVFVNCYYTLEGAALIHACRRCGVTSVDVQHGVQGDLHVAYGAWANVPELGYELLPDRFWCWSEAEVDTIESWTSGQTDRHVAILGGNPWMDMWRDEGSPLVMTADEAVRPLIRAGRRTVLVSLQWGMNDDIFLTPVIDLIARSRGSWTWWLRLHPVMRSRRSEIQECLRNRGLNDVVVDDSSMYALPALLRHADVHLTHSSSVVLEAASLGVASLVTESSGPASAPELVRRGLVAELGSLEPEIALPALVQMASRTRTNVARHDEVGPKAMKALLDQTRKNQNIVLSERA